MITCLEMIDFKICMVIPDIFSSVNISENLKGKCREIGRKTIEKCAKSDFKSTRPP